MKAKLEFNLPEDNNDYTLAIKGREFWLCLWDLDQECRNFLKHEHKFKTPDEVLEWVRDHIVEEVDIHCVE